MYFLDSHPKITSGFKNFRVLKTTKSSFMGFQCDQYCHLDDIYDRFLRLVKNLKTKLED